MFYPLTLPCPLLSSGKSTSEKSHVSTNFDYRTRLVRIPKQLKSLTPTFVFDDTELDEFLLFFDDIMKNHNFIFYADWVYEGNKNFNKAFKITSNPIVNSLGAFRYNVSFTIDFLYGGVETKPLIISDDLIISNYLLIG